DLQSIQTRQRQIEQDEIRVKHRVLSERAIAVGRQCNLETFVDQVVAEETRQRGVVLHNENTSFHPSDFLLSRGSTSSTVVPAPTPLWRRTSPWWSFMMR